MTSNLAAASGPHPGSADLPTRNVSPVRQIAAMAHRLGLAVVEFIVSTPTRILERYFGLEIDADECHQCSEYSELGEVVHLVVHGPAYCHQCDRSHPDGELCNRQIERFCYGCRKWRCLTTALLCPLNPEHNWSESMRRPLARMSPPSMMTWARNSGR